MSPYPRLITFAISYSGGEDVLVVAKTEGAARRLVLNREDCPAKTRLNVWRPSEDQAYECIQQGMEVMRG